MAFNWKGFKSFHQWISTPQLLRKNLFTGRPDALCFMKKKKVLITGCGRSGTKYIAFVLRRWGLDVPHERMGRDGCASWCMAVDAEKTPFGESCRNYEFEHIFHQVRNPLAVIASIKTFKNKSWQFICEHTAIRMGEPLLIRCAKYWYFWNLEAENISQWRYRIEDFNLISSNFCNRLQIKTDNSVLEKLPLDINTRKRGRVYHIYEELCERLRLNPSSTIARWLSSGQKPSIQDALTWEKLDAVDPDWSKRVKTKAIEYGYRY